jgi:hypothetical protein
MNRAAKKNTIPGSNPNKNEHVTTVLSSEDDLPIHMTNELGVVSSIIDEVERIISVVICLEQTRKDMFEGTKMDKNML